MIGSGGWSVRVAMSCVVAVAFGCIASAAVAAPRSSGGAHGAGAGLWLVADNGHIQSLGNAGTFVAGNGDWWRRHTAVAAAATPTGQGLWILAADGSVLPVGDASSFGPAPTASRRGGPDAVGIAAAPDGGGYLVAYADGGVRTYGDAVTHGNATPQRGDEHAIVGIAITSTGAGYWLVGADARVYPFGDATALRPALPRWGDDGRVVAVAATPTGRGLWLADADGGVVTLGDAPPLPVVGRRLDRGPVAGLAATPSGRGLWLASAGDSVEARGDATPFAPRPGRDDGRIVAAVSSAETGSLTVAVTDLPAGVAGDATATGAGPAVHVTATETLRVAAGDYQIAAQPVHAGGTTYSPTIGGSPATVGPGGTATATVDYFTAVPDTTKVVPAAAVQGATGDPATGETLTLDAATTPRLAVGDVLVFGPAPATPDGYLAKVTARTSAGGTLTVQTVPATLEEAVSRGDIDMNWSLGNGGAGSTGGSAASAAAQPHAVRRVQDLTSIEQSIAQNLSCSAGGSISLTGGVSLSGNVTFKHHWDVISLHPDITATFTGSFTETAQLGLSTQGAAGCTLAPTPLLPEPVRLPPIPFEVLGVPIEFFPEVQLELSASGDVGGSVGTDVSQTLTATGGVEFDNGSVTPIHDFHNGFTADPPSPTASASLQVKAGPVVSLLAEGVVGPKFNLDAGLDFEADTATAPPAPWWTLDGTLDAGVGLGSIPIPWLGTLDFSDPTLIHFSKTLAQSNGSVPAGAVVTVNPDPASPGHPVTVTGGSFQPYETVDLALDTGGTTFATAVTDGSGSFTTTVVLPGDAAYGSHSFTATGETSAVSGEATVMLSPYNPPLDGSIDLGTNPLDFRNEIVDNVVSPLGSKYVYYADGDGMYGDRTTIDRVAADGSSPPTVLYTINPTSYYGAMSLAAAPDGSVYWSTESLVNRGTDQAQDWLYTATIYKNGSVLASVDDDVGITQASVSASAPVLSADGTTLAYAFTWWTSVGDVETTVLHVVSTQDGSEKFTETLDNESIGPMALNADGSILLANVDDATTGHLERLDIGSGTGFVTQDGIVSSPVDPGFYQFSPVDPETFAYLGYAVDANGKPLPPELRVHDLATGDDHLVTVPTYQNVISFGFSPDGSRLAFEGPGTDSPVVWSSDLNGGARRRMTGTAAGSVSRTGGRLLWSVAAGANVAPSADSSAYNWDGDGMILYSGDGDRVVFSREAFPPPLTGGGGGGGTPGG
jgi:hypothetical protein